MVYGVVIIISMSCAKNGEDDNSVDPFVMEEPIAFSTENFFGGPFESETNLTELAVKAGNWVCGGAYQSALQNPDGTWVCGGAYRSAQQNPDGTWVCGGAYQSALQNPDGTWVCGGAYQSAQQNPDGTWVCGGAYRSAHQNPAPGIGFCFSVSLVKDKAYAYTFTTCDGAEKSSWLIPQSWFTDAKYSFTISYEQNKKSYIISDGFFKSGTIISYEQDGQYVSVLSADKPITGFIILYQNKRIHLTSTKL